MSETSPKRVPDNQTRLISAILLWIIGFSAAIAFGKHLPALQVFSWIALCYLIYILCVFWHEVGHLVTGLMRGFEIVQFSVMGRALYLRTGYTQLGEEDYQGFVCGLKFRATATDLRWFLVGGPLFNAVGIVGGIIGLLVAYSAGAPNLIVFCCAVIALFNATLLVGGFNSNHPYADIRGLRELRKDPEKFVCEHHFATLVWQVQHKHPKDYPEEEVLWLLNYPTRRPMALYFLSTIALANQDWDAAWEHLTAGWETIQESGAQTEEAALVAFTYSARAAHRGERIACDAGYAFGMGTPFVDGIEMAQASREYFLRDREEGILMFRKLLHQVRQMGIETGYAQFLHDLVLQMVPELSSAGILAPSPDGQ